jgi:hypothetical protein
MRISVVLIEDILIMKADDTVDLFLTLLGGGGGG